MRAVVWHGEGDIRVDDVAEPRIVAPTDAVVRVTSTAIGGADLHRTLGPWPGVREGDVLGHEPMGIVEEVGSDVAHLVPGDRVVVPCNVACGRCAPCRQGLQSQCDTARGRDPATRDGLPGVPPDGLLIGGQAERLRVPQAHYGPIKVPDGPPDTRFLFLSDVLPAAWQAVDHAAVPPDGTVVVLGLGAVGQLACRAARHRGAGRVVGVDRVPARLAMADRHGFETVDLSTADDVGDAALELTRGRGFDSAVDAVGTDAAGSLLDAALTTVGVQADRLRALHDCLRSLRRGGTLSISGTYVGADPRFPLGDLFDRQLSIRAGRVNVRRWVDDLLPLLTDDDPLGTDDLATHALPLDGAPQAHATFQAREDGYVKVVLTP